MRRALPTSAVNKVTLDANIFVRVLVPGEYSAQADALWNSLLTGSRMCWVPEFCPKEVISSLRQIGRGGVLLPEEEGEAVDRFITQIYPFLTPVGGAVLTRSAWESARDLGERHTYDSVYLAIAQRLNIDFWTADLKLLHRLNGRVPQARFLGDYPMR